MLKQIVVNGKKAFIDIAPKQDENQVDIFDALEVCETCGFDDEWIVDCDDRGEEYTFCGNCGRVKGELKRA